MPSQPHKPLGLRDLLAETLHIFWGHLRLYMALILPFPLFFLLVAFLVVYSLVPRDSGADALEMWRNISSLGKWAVIAAYLTTFAVLHRVYAATVFVASEAHLGRTITFWQALGRTRRRGLRFLWLLFIINLLAAPTGLLAAPAVALSVVFAPAIPISLLEDLKVGAALKRSSFLTEGGYGRVVLLALLYVIACFAAMAAYLAFLGVAAGFWNSSEVWLARFGFTALLAAFGVLGQLLMTALTLNYYDQLARKEQPVPSS